MPVRGWARCCSGRPAASIFSEGNLKGEVPLPAREPGTCKQAASRTLRCPSRVWKLPRGALLAGNFTHYFHTSLSASRIGVAAPAPQLPRGSCKHWRKGKRLYQLVSS